METYEIKLSHPDGQRRVVHITAYSREQAEALALQDYPDAEVIPTRAY